MKKNRLFLFVLFVIFMMGFCCQAMAQSNAGVLWLGTKSLPAKFLAEVGKGNIPGHSVVHKFGHANVGTSLVPITSSLAYQTPTAAVALEFVSDDADDTAAGAGAREITFIGIDANYDEIIQVIATNGLTAVSIPTPMLRLYRWYVSASGSYATQTVGSHEGTLTVRVASAGATWDTLSIVPFPAGQSEIGAYTVPDGFRAYILQQEFAVAGTKAVDVILFKRIGIDVVSAPFTTMRQIVHFVGLTGFAPMRFLVPINSFPARTDLGYMAKVTSGTANVTVHFLILLVEDGY